MVIGCTGNYRKKEYFKIIDKIFNILSKKNIKMHVSSDLLKGNYKFENNYSLLDFKDIIRKCDVIFAIGGDGTILSTVRRLQNIVKPILGIHIGRLGFLSECVEDNLEHGIDCILKNQYEISNRMLLQVDIESKEIKRSLSALNDIVISDSASTRMFSLDVNVSGSYLNTYEGDGIIISTPTGSTAYSLSAGGPIIYPSINSILITPICSHSLSARSIVLESREIIIIDCPDVNNEVGLAVDGQIVIPINNKTKIKIYKSKHKVQLINLHINGYFSTLRTKMGWSGNVR